MNKLSCVLTAIMLLVVTYSVSAQTAVKSDLLIQFVSQNADASIKQTMFMRMDQGDDCDADNVSLAWSSKEHEDMVVVRHCVTPTAPVPSIEMGTFTVVPAPAQ